MVQWVGCGVGYVRLLGFFFSFSLTHSQFADPARQSNSLLARRSKWPPPLPQPSADSISLSLSPSLSSMATMEGPTAADQEAAVAADRAATN